MTNTVTKTQSAKQKTPGRAGKPRGADAPKRKLNSTAASLLGFLHEGPKSGWDLATEAQHRIGEFWTITQSQVYRELGTMDTVGLVEKGPPGARDRTPYVITDAGRDAFLEWISHDPGSETIRFPLLLTLSFGEHLDRDRLHRMIESNKRIHEDRLEKYLADVPEDHSPYTRATVDFGIRYERAVLEWFEQLPHLLAD